MSVSAEADENNLAAIYKLLHLSTHLFTCKHVTQAHRQGSEMFSVA